MAAVVTEPGSRATRRKPRPSSAGCWPVSSSWRGRTRDWGADGGTVAAGERQYAIELFAATQQPPSARLTAAPRRKWKRKRGGPALTVKTQNQVTAALRPSYQALSAQLPAQQQLSIDHAASRAATPSLSSPPPSKRISPTNPPLHSSPGCEQLPLGTKSIGFVPSFNVIEV